MVVSILPHAEFGPNGHREDTPHFIIYWGNYPFSVFRQENPFLGRDNANDPNWHLRFVSTKSWGVTTVFFGSKLRKYDLLAHLELNLGLVVDYLI